jgi:hypothetical protein
MDTRAVGRQSTRRSAAGSVFLNTDVHTAESIFVSFARFGSFPVRVVLDEVRIVPLLPGDHRVVGSGERFLCANRVYPFIYSLFVGSSQLVKIWFAHNRGRLLRAGWSGQMVWANFSRKINLRRVG